jgi:hypothetical protein
MIDYVKALAGSLAEECLISSTSRGDRAAAGRGASGA